MYTLADYTQPLRPDIPQHIIADQAFDRILDLTQHFSGALSNLVFCFEVHLRQSPSSADFSFSFPASSRESLLDLADFKHFSSPQPTPHPVWQKVRAFARLWNDPMHPVHQYTNHVWLEFDLDRPVAATPAPDLFYCQHTAEDPSSTILALSDIFYGSPLTARVREQLVRCLQQLPTGALVSQVGFGLQRDGDGIRLQIMRLPAQDIPAYLQAVGWTYATEPLRPLLDLISRYDMWTVMIDVSARQLKPKLGFECSLLKFGEPFERRLDDLTHAGLCDAAKLPFLAGFPGVKLHYLDHQGSITQQRLSHIKFVYHPEKTSAPFEAKAYLFYRPCWYTANVAVVAPSA